jgi:hypothetical protein
MRRSLILVTLCVSAVGLAGPSLAAPKLAKAHPLTVTDAAGDANGVNSQGGLLPASPPEQSNGSVNDGAADILSFTLGRKDNGSKVTALVGTLTLAAPPAQGTDYRIRMATADCSTYFLEYEFPPGLGASGEVRENCGGATTAAFDPVDATVTGNTITWTIPIKALPGSAKLGTVLNVKGAQTSVETAAIIPGIDQVVTSQSFVIGS